jgi:intracellular sulfur oxidation DsrE/DsrF family protein
MSQVNQLRRAIMKYLGLLAGVGFGKQAYADHTETHLDASAIHKIVYQCNKSDPEYLRHILFSAGEILRKYGDDVEIVIAAFGPGIHMLGKKPLRPVPDDVRSKVRSLAIYGVRFHACGNTMKSIGWTAKDLLDLAVVVPIGVDDVMQLQERGFAYLSW